MGMAASQVRFLQLTGRKHDISRELQHLSLEKMALTRDMQAVTRDYQKALSSKTMKWSGNSGVTYTDISYATLMRPNSVNMKSPILVSDSSGRIVLDKKYQKYAQMLDAAGGNWEGSIKDQILSELTGIPQADIETANSNAAAVTTATNNYNKCLEDLDKWKAKEEDKAGTQYLTIDKLAKNLGTVNGKDLASLYTKGANGDYHISSAADIQSLATGIMNNMGKYFVDDEKYLGITDASAFKKACQTFADIYSDLLDNTNENADNIRENYGLKGESGDWTLDISYVFKYILSEYKEYGGSYKEQNTSENITYPLRDTTSTRWNSWYGEFVSKQEALDAAKTEYDSSVNTANQAMTADKETQLRYFDLLFQAVADNGWTYDAQIEDPEYLNQVFQNNSYYITTITENKCFDSTIPLSERNYKYESALVFAPNIFWIVLCSDCLRKLRNMDGFHRSIPEIDAMFLNGLFVL